MFLRFYNLDEQPFGMTPDPRFMYQSASHREAFASLVYGIEAGRGFVGLIAEPGMGKTTLLFQLMERLQNSARTVFLFQTQRDSRELLCNLIADLGLDPQGQDLGSLQRQLNEILVREAQLGRQFVLIIDEAQNLPFSVLESVRMLSNFETPRRKLMQIILAGQPPLANKLDRPELEQLKQRVSIICRLEPFTEEEVAGYVKHRLKTAGYKGGQLFSDEALAIVARQSGGIPRNINNLCFHALSLGYAEGKKKIDRSIVEEVLLDLNLESVKGSHAKVQAPNAEIGNSSGSLESVTLNSATPGEDGDDFRVLFRGSTKSPSSSRAGSARGVKRPPRQHPHWLFWAAALLMLVLAGEVFWAYLPADTSTHGVAQLIDGAVEHAKEIATKQKLFSTSGSHSQSRLKTTVINSNSGSSGQVQKANSAGQGTSANSTAGEPQPSAASDEQAANPTKDSTSAAKSPRKPAPHEVRISQTAANYPSAPVHHSVNAAKGKIVVEANVKGGSITIDGKSKPAWQTPHMFSLPKGTYQVAISKSGYSTWFKDIRVNAGSERWIVAHLRAPRGVVVIDTQPPGMQVYIDGKSYGPSEVEASLSVGRHTYKVIPPGGERPLTGTFVLKPGTVLTRKIRWLPAGGRASAQNSPDSQNPQSSTNSQAGRERS